MVLLKLLMNIISWIKNNKLSSFLLLIFAFFLLQGALVGSSPVSQLSSLKKSSKYVDTYEVEGMSAPAADMMAGSALNRGIVSESAPQPEAKDRLVVETSNMSMVVDDVRQKLDEIPR